MINTKNLVVRESDIPSYWVFQYYLNINEILTGQDLKITSPWNPIEKTPSMCIYVDTQKQCYMFKDFSTNTDRSTYSQTNQKDRSHRFFFVLQIDQTL